MKAYLCCLIALKWDGPRVTVGTIPAAYMMASHLEAHKTNHSVNVKELTDDEVKKIAAVLDD